MFLLTAALVLLPPAWGEVFFYKHKTGDKYRILSTVNESVYMDRRLSHRAEVLNRIAVTVEEEAGGRARHRGQFQTAERAVGQGGMSYQWARDYESVFERDRQGYITIDKGYFMPVVRNVPVFPAWDLKPGDTWSAEGHEVHDFRDSFGIDDPYRISFTANYTYLGMRKRQGKEYPAFSVSYRVFNEPEAVQGRIWPWRIIEASDQVVFWDFEMGQARAYEEEFRVVLELSNGRTVEYRGNAEAEILESSGMDKERIAGEIERDLDSLGMGDASVRVVEDGIAISLENIQFDADSAVLLPGETAKLDKIGEILLKYRDRDILVGGHTALAGTAEGRQRLSGERAAAVADYFIKRQVRDADRIVVRGFGAEQPLGDNGTEKGRQRNRRVEITLLEN
ncbi:MAG: OmpA family protein [Treponema sp.]|nr:OmpA family protein [Treponema sp.]